MYDPFPLSDEQYRQQYFDSLPEYIKESIFQSGLSLPTAEDLQRFVQNLKEQK
jgi:SMC interacting uncharacterized protein involved in chromosome segregation